MAVHGWMNFDILEKLEARLCRVFKIVKSSAKYRLYSLKSSTLMACTAFQRFSLFIKISGVEE